MAQPTTPPDTEPRPARVQAPADPQVLDAARYLSVLEDHLLSRPASRIGFRINAEGAFVAELAGELVLERNGDASLHARGAANGDSLALALTATGGRLSGSGGPRSFEVPVPPELREALLIGLTRMGLLHNLARIMTGAPPDHADGGVREWVVAEDVVWADSVPAPAASGLRFKLLVAGQPSGDARLWLDARGRPISRDQVVRFPGGEMRVREQYDIR